MSNLRKKSKVALLVSDIHLSHNPPSCLGLSREEWYKAMEVTLVRLKEKANGLPIICAGDVFDRWNSPPELVNFAMKFLPQMYSIPGQHDLPNHRIDSIERSAYKTLEMYGTLKELSPNNPVMLSPGVSVYGFPWLTPLTNPTQKIKSKIRLAVTHRYIYPKGSGFPGADKKASLDVWMKERELKGFTAIHLGDNHTPFCCGKVINPGSLFIRSTDYPYHDHTKIGFLFSDGSVSLEDFPSEHGKVNMGKVVSSLITNEDFIELMEEVQKNTTGFSFRNLLKSYIGDNEESKEARLLQEIISDADHQP